MNVIIDKEIWNQIGRHAAESFPEECVGFFVGFTVKNSERMGIVGIHPCPNISKDKSTESVVSRRLVKKLMKECEKLNGVTKGFFVGQYHSHPTTGSTVQSELDQATGKKWKAYRYQLILGMHGNKVTGIRKKFYHYDRINKVWRMEKIVIK